MRDDARRGLARQDTARLLSLALAEVRATRRGDGGEHLPALATLHERSDDETRLAALALIRSPDASERQLAARIMRELGSPHVTTRAHADEFLPVLTRAIERETDQDALWWELSSLWWQGAPAAIDTLLRFAGHAEPRVRETVANGLRTLAWIADELSDPIAEALVRLAGDAHPWVAGSVLYDVADTPEQFREHRDAFLQAARIAAESVHAPLRDEARAALLVLEPMPLFPAPVPPADHLRDDVIELRLVRVMGAAEEMERAPEARFLSAATELRFAIHRRADGVRVGRVHLRLTDDPTIVRAVGHAGYEIDEAHRRRGYASRALARARAVAHHYGVEPFAILIAPDNEASRRTAVRAGFEYVETRPSPPEALAMGLDPALCRYVAGPAAP